MKPCFGVFLECYLSALNNVDSAPNIYIVLAGLFANFIKDPALANNLAPITEPTI